MAKLPSAKQVSKGVSIYRVSNSPYWMVRVWDRKRKKYITKTTSERSSVLAKEAAQELAISLLASQPVVPTEFTFENFAKKFLNKSRVQAKVGELNSNYVKTMHWAVTNADWGLFEFFKDKDVRELRPHSWQEYLVWVSKRRPALAPSTQNTLAATFRNVLKVAQEEGAIGNIPQTPKVKTKDNPRPFFRFHPLVKKDEDAYQKLLSEAKRMADNSVVVRGTEVTEELYDLILFVVHSFVRPTTSELYALKHGDVVVEDDPRRLVLNITNGKTGFRYSNTMPAAVSVYERICERNPGAAKDAHLFFPQYKNRTTVRDIVRRQFKELLKRSNLTVDPATGKAFSLYSLRHTAICLRIVKSEGRVNIYNLARNAGTSVDQLERFYTRYLPANKELARNLQSFGE